MEENLDSDDANCRYMLEMFPAINPQTIRIILSRNKNDLERSMDEALSVAAIEEELRGAEADRSQAAGGGGDGRARVPQPDKEKQPGGEAAGGRGCRMALPAGFLAIPRTRISVDDINRRFTDFTFCVHKSQTSKIGISLCRAGGSVALYSVNASLMQMRDENSHIETIRPGDILLGINQEFFGSDASIEHISLVLSNVGSNVLLHLRRVDPSSAHIPLEQSQEHAMVRLILQAYKSAPSGFTEGFSDALALARSRLLTWDDGYVLQKIPNKLLKETASDDMSRDVSSLISSVLTGADPRATGSGGGSFEPRTKFNPAQSFAPRTALEPQGRKRMEDTSLSMNSRRGNSILSSLVLSDAAPLEKIKENWKQRVKVSIRNLRPALNVRLLKVVKHRNNGFTEYVLSVSDILTGYEWVMSKGYTDFSDIKKKIFEKSPNLFTQLPLLSKTDNSMVQKFLKSLIAILEVSLLTKDLLEIYLDVMNFFEVGEKSAYLSGLSDQQSLVTHIHRAAEAHVHCVLQTPQLRQLTAMAISSCSSLLEDDVSRVRRIRQKGPGLSRTRGDGTSDFHSADIPAGAPKSISSAPALQTVSRWLDSMQDLLVSGLIDDIRVVAREAISRHTRKLQLKNQQVNCGNSSRKISVCIGDANEGSAWSDVASDDDDKMNNLGLDPPLDWSTTLFDRLEDMPVDPRGSLSAVLSDTSTLQQWLDDNKHRPVDENFIIPPDMFHPLVREAVRRQVELELFAPLENHIRIIISDICLDNDCEISENLQKIISFTQSDFGIPKSIQSPSNWKAIAVMLRNMFAKSIPFDRIQALKAAVKEIPVLYDKERQERDLISGERSSLHIGADDMLPIFIYLLATSDLPFGLSSLSFEIDSLCDDKLKISETGYILATFEASVHHLTTIKAQKEQDIGGNSGISNMLS